MTHPELWAVAVIEILPAHPIITALGDYGIHAG
jgi:hypothetical protein